MENVLKEKQKKIADLYGQIMYHLGVNWTDENRDTPDRVAKALLEQTSTMNRSLRELEKQLALFTSPHPSSVELVIEDIPFSSMCAHHHMPFMGTALIRYNPGEQIFGLSKFARVVEWFSRKPQTQEHMTVEIGEFLRDYLNPERLYVELKQVTHTCMTSRGVKCHGAVTSTNFRYVKPKVAPLKPFNIDVQLNMEMSPEMQEALKGIKELGKDEQA